MTLPIGLPSSAPRELPLETEGWWGDDDDDGGSRVPWSWNYDDRTSKLQVGGIISKRASGSEPDSFKKKHKLASLV